jgi:hypothetical protein
MATLLATVLCLAASPADTAKVWLTDGTVLRGAVELTQTELTLHNAAGQVSYPRQRVTRIEWFDPPQTVQANYLRRFWELPADDVAEHFALAQWLVEHRLFDAARTQCAYVLKFDSEHQGAKALLEKAERSLEGEPEPTAQAAAESGEQLAGDQDATTRPSHSRYEGVPPPPVLSESDIQRLKLLECDLDGPPERLNVRFIRPRGAPDLESLVREDLRNAGDYDPDWLYTLEHGEPREKLQVILKTTGLKYADRIEVLNHPAAFATYRRRVLPLVTRGCVRSGCHGGRAAHAFRFPAGSQSRDGYVYASFVILDRMNTAAGPMIDRGSPEQSALLRFLLPAEEGQEVHPPVEHRRVRPVLRNPRDPRYQAVVEWIGSLRSPHPDYQLDYEFAVWAGQPPEQPDAAPAREPSDEEAIGPEPASVPGADDQGEAEAGAPAEDP